MRRAVRPSGSARGPATALLATLGLLALVPRGAAADAGPARAPAEAGRTAVAAPADPPGQADGGSVWTRQAASDAPIRTRQDAVDAPIRIRQDAVDAPIRIRQDAVDEEERLRPETAATVARVLVRNQALLGAYPIDFCGRMARDERRRCLAESDGTRPVRIGQPVELDEIVPLPEGGRQWPNADAVSDFRRIRLSVPLEKGTRVARHEASMVEFLSRRRGTAESCVFPLEHWSWSEMDLPERFAQAPVGVCGDRELTFTEYLLEQAPSAAPVALRFLAEAEAQAWRSGNPERIKWESPYTAGHPYAKYFLLDSERWWRGGRATGRSRDYGWAVRIDALPLRRVRELEKRGDAFLDVFEDAAQVELTSVTRDGLLALLAEHPEVLIDVSGAKDDAPRFEPLPRGP